MDILKPITRIQESFIGNNKKLKPKKVRKMAKPKPVVILGKGMSAIVEPAIPKPVVQKQKIERATLNQKMCIYAICMKLYNKKELAKEISNRYGKSRDLASNKIQELLQIQRSREVLAKWITK